MAAAGNDFVRAPDIQAAAVGRARVVVGAVLGGHVTRTIDALRVGAKIATLAVSGVVRILAPGDRVARIVGADIFVVTVKEGHAGADAHQAGVLQGTDVAVVTFH